MVVALLVVALAATPPDFVLSLLVFVDSLVPLGVLMLLPLLVFVVLLVFASANLKDKLSSLFHGRN
jgi:hypothetical protein